MRAQKLTLERIFESDFNFDLAKDNCFSLDEIQKIRKGVLLVINGDATIAQGVATFSFNLGNDSYIITRNFDENSLDVLKNNQKLEVDSDISNSIFGISCQTFERLFMINDNDLDDILCSPAAYLEKLMSLYSLDKETLQEKSKLESEIVQKLNVQLEYLQNQKLQLENLKNDETDYFDDIEKLEADIAQINRMLFLADSVQEGKKQLESFNQELEAAKENTKILENYKSQLEKNEKIENSIFLINKNKEIDNENKELDTHFDELNSKLNDLQVDYDNKTTQLDELKKEYLLANEKLVETNSKFESYVLDGPDLADTNSDFYKKMAAYYANYDKKAEKLSETYSALSQEFETLSGELSQVKQELLDAKYPSSVKKAVRDGLVIETSLSSKISLLEKINTEIDDANARIETLKGQIERNNLELKEAKAKSEENLGKSVTYAQIYAELNEDEKQKQTLYRNQIMIANTEREISAVDNKIYENEEAQRSYVEDKNVLENAKSTLLGYIKKLDDKLKGIDDKLVLVSAKKKYHDAIDAASFGDKCPVCKGQILEKADFSKESNLIEKAYNDLLIEKQKAALVKKDYDAQLEKINIRLGELSNRIDTSITYLKSLKDTKAAKYELIKNLLKLSRARSFSDLTTMLDAAIKKVAITTNEFIEVGKFNLLETCLLRGIEEANSEIKHLEDVVLKNANFIKENTNKVIDNYNKELSSIYQEIDKATAEKQAIEITAGETAEDELEIKIANLSLKESELLQSITKIEQELISIASRDNTILVEKDGENLTYPQLFVSLLKDNYTEQFNLLKLADAKKQDLEDKYTQELDLLKAKKEEINTLSKEIATLEAKKDNNKKMQALLNENAGFDPSLYNAQDEQLSQEKKDKMLAFIKDNDTKVEVISAKIDALSQFLDINKKYVDTYDENLSAKAELMSILYEKRDLLINKEKASANLDFVVNEIINSQKELGFTKENLECLDALAKNDFTILINKAKSELKNLSSEQFSFEEKEGKIVVLENGKQVSSSLGKAYALIALEKAMEDIAKDVKNILQRFIVLDASGLDENWQKSFSEVAASYNFNILNIA